ncbi:general transcription factor II-I repeat domain-containing protein 2B-like [Salvelinus alpinus]|uniref:general transcription factor II-I repeat domain-containing protein 2B-like n=1 Tax=Salvelinus alpinus TaxID=8036 RepID=UPI0039FC09D7
MKSTTTGKDLLEVNKCVAKLGLSFEKLSSVTIDGCPNLTGKNIGLLKRIQGQVAELNPEQKNIFLHCIIHQEVIYKCLLKMSHVVDTVTTVVNFIKAQSLNHRQFVSLLEETESDHADLPYPTNVRWLSLDKVLKRVWDLKSEIAEVLQINGKYVDSPQLQDKEWLADFAFTVDIMALMNELNSKLQGKGLFAHQMYSLVKAFKGKLLLLTSQVEANNLTHLPTLLVCSLSDDQREKYTLLLRGLNGEFSCRFEDFKVLENDMLLVSSPFTFNVDNAPTDLQLELIDLQSDAVIVLNSSPMSLMRFYASLD